MTLLPAIQAKWDALTASGFAGGTVPPIFHDQAAQVVSGLQLRPPYCVVSLAAGDNLLCFEDEGVEETRVTFRVFDTDEGNLDSAVAAVRRNGQPTSALAGFDSGTLPALTDGVLLSMILQRTPVKAYSGVSYLDTRVYVATLEYLVSVERS